MFTMSILLTAQMDYHRWAAEKQECASCPVFRVMGLHKYVKGRNIETIWMKEYVQNVRNGNKLLSPDVSKNLST